MREHKDEVKTRTKDYLWQKGAPSPNPAGRPKGIKNNPTKSRKQRAQEAIISMFELDSDSDESYLVKYLEVFKKESIENPYSYAHKLMGDALFGKDLLTDLDKQLNAQYERDKDFSLFRIRNLAFDKQQGVLDTKSRNIGLQCGRRSGKTEVNVLKAKQVRVERPKARVLVIGLTILKTIDIYMPRVKEMADKLGIPYREDNELNQVIYPEGALIQFGGNANKAEREKYRGQYWDLVIIDECQSQPALKMLVEEIIMPTLVDTDGIIMLTGSGARTPGTYWERFFSDQSGMNYRDNWNLSSNPHIKNYETALERIRQENKLSETDSLYMREYLGLSVYDTEALVFRMTADNVFADDQLSAWLKTQRPSDIRFTAGLDFGFTDANAFLIICYSRTSNLKWVVYEHKAYGEDYTALVEAVNEGIAYVANDDLFAAIPYKTFTIYADSARPDTIREMSFRDGLPVAPAYKVGKEDAIDTFRTEVKRSWLKVRDASYLKDESDRTVYRRNEDGEGGLPVFITKEIDDDIYHPDALDAAIYSLRDVWSDRSNNGVVEEDITKPSAPAPQDQQIDKVFTEFDESSPFIRRF